MRIIGTLKKIDNLGRIVIPKEYRDILETGKYDKVEMLLTNEGILIRKAAKNCVLCGSYNNLLDFDNNLICLHCIGKIKEL